MHSVPHLWRNFVAIILAVAFWSAHSMADAASVVISNRTGSTVQVRVSGELTAPAPSRIAAGDLISMAVSGPIRVEFRSNKQPRNYQLEPNSVYYFGTTQSGHLDLAEIATRPAGTAAKPDQLAAAASAAKPTTSTAKPATNTAKPAASDSPTNAVNAAAMSAFTPAPAAPASNFADPRKLVITIPVKILVDEEEHAPRHAWRSRLSARLKETSDILERHCRVRLEAVAYETWQSDNNISEFTASLQEFEQKVDPKPGRVAIGFTSQYQIPKGRTNLGGTRQPFHSHILLREWSQHVTEPERLEVLLHEVGHLLGAAHSPEPDSVMRPLLGDRQSRLRQFRIGFDPLNTLVISLIGEDLRVGDVRSLRSLTPATQLRLRDLYGELNKALPDDPAAANYLKLLPAE